MTIHLQKFVDRVRGQEARGARDLVMTMNEARDLHADITRLLLTLQALQEKQIKTMLDVLKRKKHDSYTAKMNRAAIPGSLPIFSSPTGVQETNNQLYFKQVARNLTVKNNL